MRKSLQALAALFISLCLTPLGGALAASTTTFSGTVVAGESVSVTAPFGGTVSAFSLRAGAMLNAGDPIATIETTKVYAPADGVITGVFAQAGDSVDSVTARYGTVLYIAPERKYTISADIEKAYNSAETRYVNIGERVYLSCTADGTHTATGVITAVNGTAYTVETLSGELLMGETVNVYRSATVETKSRIGRGTVSRTAEVSVGGSGSILAMHVKDGDSVSRGDLLFETVTGSFDGLYATSNQITAAVSGIIASVDTAAGNTVNKGQTLLTVYPREGMQVEISVTEYDLSGIQEGDKVYIGFNWEETEQMLYEGTVDMVSHVSSGTGSEAEYAAYIRFTPPQSVRLGMSVVVYTADDPDVQEMLKEAGLSGEQASDDGAPQEEAPLAADAEE